MIPNPTLPADWTSEALSERHTLITAPSRGSVTIDWGRGDYYSTRGYRGGYSTTGKLTSIGRRYQGRGWKQRLIADAVAWLQGRLP